MPQFKLGSDTYYLTESEAEEVDEADASFPSTPEGDKQFNAWFKKFTKKRHIYPANKRLSSWWTKTSNTTDNNIKFATTMRACRSILSVIDVEHKLSLEYKNVYTSSWSENKVTLPIEPVREIEDLHHLLDVEGGFAIHEGTHSKRSRPLMSPETMKFLESSKVNMVLANLLEDIRALEEEFKENPGFRIYEDKMRQYLHDRYPIDVPNWPDAKDAMKVQGLINHFLFKEELDRSWEKVIADVSEVVNQHRDKPNIVTNVRALKKALELTEKEEEEANEKPHLGVNTPCGFVHGEDAEEMNDRQNKEIEGLIEREVESDDPNDPMYIPLGEKGPQRIVIQKPKFHGNRRLEPLRGLLAKAKAAVQLRRAAPRADERLMTSGELDEDELYRMFTTTDMRVFRDISEEVVPSACIYMLVDLSGSMYYWMDDKGFTTRRDAATKWAHLLVEALLNRPNVKTRVLAHTTVGYETAGFFRVWEQGDNINRLTMMQNGDDEDNDMIKGGDNYDSYAIAWAGKLLEQEDAEQKLLIVISDGQPAAFGRYGGYAAMDHVRKHTDNLMKKGIDVVQIAIGGLNEGDQARMFKHYIPAKGTDTATFTSVLRHLERLMLKFTTRQQ